MSAIKLPNTVKGVKGYEKVKKDKGVKASLLHTNIEKIDDKYDKYAIISASDMMTILTNVFLFFLVNSGTKPVEEVPTYNKDEYVELTKLGRILQILSKVLDPSYTELFFKTVQKGGVNSEVFVDFSRIVPGQLELTESDHRGNRLWESKTEEERLAMAERYYEAFCFLKFILQNYHSVDCNIFDHIYMIPSDNLVRDIAAMFHNSWGNGVFEDISSALLKSEKIDPLEKPLEKSLKESLEDKVHVENLWFSKLMRDDNLKGTVCIGIAGGFLRDQFRDQFRRRLEVGSPDISLIGLAIDA